MSDRTRTGRPAGPDRLHGNDQVAQMLTETSGRLNHHPRTLRRGKRTARLTDEGLTVPRGDAALPLDTETPTSRQLLPLIGHQNRATRHPEHDPLKGEGVAVHLTSGGGILTDRIHH